MVDQVLSPAVAMVPVVHAPAFCGPPGLTAWSVTLSTTTTTAAARGSPGGGRPRGGGAPALGVPCRPSPLGVVPLAVASRTSRWASGDAPARLTTGVPSPAPLSRSTPRSTTRCATMTGGPPQPPVLPPPAAHAADVDGAGVVLSAPVALPPTAGASPSAEGHPRRTGTAGTLPSPPARRERSTPRRRRRRPSSPTTADLAASASAASTLTTASLLAVATPADSVTPVPTSSPPASHSAADVPPTVQGGSRRTTRRNALALTSAFLVASVAVVAVPPAPAKAVAVAPTPINPYARRRRIKAYKLYLEQLQKELNTVTAPAATTGVGARPVLVPEADAPKAAAASFKVAGISAFVASAIATAICHPIDTWKALKQQERRNPDGSADEASSVATILGPYPVARLYRGVESNILKEAPNAAVYLAVYELLKTALLTVPFFAAHPLVAFLVAGALGDAVGSILRVPAELVNKRLQLGLNDTVGGAVRDQFFNESGLEVTLASWGAVLLRDMPYGAVQIGVYEQVKLAIASSSHPTVLSTLAAAVSHFSSAAAAGAGTGATAATSAATSALAIPGILDDVLVGAFAGAIAAVLTTPMDVLVTRVAVQAPRCDLDTRRYAGVRSVLGRLLAEEGPSALWSGWLQRGLFYAPLIGLFFTLYEGTRFAVVHPQVITDVVVAAEGLPAAVIHAIGTFARGLGQAAPATVACVGDWFSSVAQP